MSSAVLSVQGDRIVDAAGSTVVLRGYNVGGWMNMENFLTGYPGTESAAPARPAAGSWGLSSTRRSSTGS